MIRLKLLADYKQFKKGEEISESRNVANALIEQGVARYFNIKDSIVTPEFKMIKKVIKK